MTRIMFPFSQAELERRERELQASKPKKQWTPQGCFRDRRMSPRERQFRADETRLWLMELLYKGPLPAREVLQRASAEGVPLRGLHRAKRHYGVESIRVGGLAWRGKWVWQFPTEAGANC